MTPGSFKKSPYAETYVIISLDLVDERRRVSMQHSDAEMANQGSRMTPVMGAPADGSSRNLMFLMTLTQWMA